MLSDIIDRGMLEHVQRVANETRTRVVFFDTEIVGEVEHERMVVIEPAPFEFSSNV